MFWMLKVLNPELDTLTPVDCTCTWEPPVAVAIFCIPIWFDIWVKSACVVGTRDWVAI